MKTVYKYELFKRYSDTKIYMPKGAKILSVQVLYRSIVLWALVDSIEDLEERHFFRILTGESIPNKCLNNYLDTVLVGDHGGTVYHIFEAIDK